jgi:hypothetical protein
MDQPAASGLGTGERERADTTPNGGHHAHLAPPANRDPGAETTHQSLGRQTPDQAYFTSLQPIPVAA